MYGARGSTAHLTGGGSGRSMAPLVMACAPAEAPPGLSGWAWLSSLSWPSFCLVLLGYVTAGAVTFWPVLNTFMGAWHMQAVGRGTRGEPFVLSLLSYTCALYLSLMSNGWHLDDSVWINGLGALFYMVYLVLFLRLADDDHRRTTLSTWVVAGAVVYLGLVVGIGVATESTDAVQWMCTLVALAATCVPLALAYFVMDRYLENLPDWLSSTVGLLYSVVWFVLGLVPEPDYHALGQNATGAVCCLLFLVLLTRWPSNPAAGADQNDPLFDYHAIEAPHEVVNEGAKPPLVAEQQPLVAEQQPPLVEDPPPPPLVAEQQPLVAIQQPLVADPVPLVADPQGAIPPPAAV